MDLCYQSSLFLCPATHQTKWLARQLSAQVDICLSCVAKIDIEHYTQTLETCSFIPNILSGNIGFYNFITA